MKNTIKEEFYKGLNLWNQVDKTDPRFIKSVKNSGHSFSAIDSTSQFLQATKIFDGPYGTKWGLKDLDYTFETLADTKLLILKAKFFYPGGEFEISNSIKLAYMTGYKGKPGYLKIDDEAFTKIETSTVSKALAKLGFNSDVFMGNFEDNDHIQRIIYHDVLDKKNDTDEFCI